MTKQQRSAIERLERHIAERARGHEFKFFGVVETDYGKVILSAETGLPDDEGTLASIFCRNSYWFSVGPRGGLTTYNKKGTRITGRKALWATQR